jgi:hypothetical protein
VPPKDADSALDSTTETNRAATITTQVHALCTQLDTLDAEIAELEPQVAMLPATLAALAGHPVLWLLLGREGVDRPGGLGAVLGQQVVTITRVDRRALMLAGVVMLLIGLAAGIGLGLWYGGA